MISSDYLYNGLDYDTATLQLALFQNKKKRALAVITALKPQFDLLDFSDKQKALQLRVDKIRKAIGFCDDMINEAKEALK